WGLSRPSGPRRRRRTGVQGGTGGDLRFGRSARRAGHALQGTGTGRRRAHRHDGARHAHTESHRRHLLDDRAHAQGARRHGRGARVGRARPRKISGGCQVPVTEGTEGTDSTRSNEATETHGETKIFFFSVSPPLLRFSVLIRFLRKLRPLTVESPP